MSNQKGLKKHQEKIQRLKGFKTAMLIYFVLIFLDSYTAQNVVPTWLAVVSKILPILVLIRFTLLERHDFLADIRRSRYTQSAFLGLCFSAMGDTALVFQKQSDIFFVAGIIAFALGHVMYIRAFGWRPFNIKVFALFSTVALGLYWYLYHGGLNNEESILQVGVAGYAAIIACMNWRSWARLSVQDYVDGRWYEFLGCIGAFFFLVSDSSLAINKFVFPVPYGDYVIMVTYYVAQLGIALSVVDGPDTYPDDDIIGKKK